MLRKEPRLFEKNSMIYIDYRNDSGKRIRRSLRLEYNSKNLKIVMKNIDRVLSKLDDEFDENKKAKESYKMENFCFSAIESSSFNRSSRTQEDYNSKIERLILPYFKELSVENIKVQHIDDWQAKLLQKYSTTTVKRCKSILSMILDRALADEIITRNPVQYSRKFKVSHKKQEPYSLEEMKKLLQYSTGKFKAFMHLAFTTGMRPGELLGLKWKDIDFDRGDIHLKRSISKGIVTNNTHTKNHDRLVVAPKMVLDMIKEIDKTSEYIFVNSYGKPFYEPKSISKVYLQPLCDELGIKYKGLKATRHTYVSIMRNRGVSQDFITDIVGHSKLVSDKHYFTNETTNEKHDAVNGVFLDILEFKDPIEAPRC
jgi:integrase